MRNFILPWGGVFVILMLFSKLTSAQQIYVTSDDIEDLTARTLVVVLADANYIGYSDSSFIDTYNLGIQKAVDRLWYLNPEVIYCHATDLQTYKKDRKNYAILDLQVHKDEKGQFQLSELRYNRMERSLKKPDYGFYIPVFDQQLRAEVSYYHLQLSLRLIQMHLAQIEQFADYDFSFSDYAERQAHRFKNKLKGSQCFIPQPLVDEKISASRLSSAFRIGEVALCSSADVAQAIDKQQNVMVGFAFPLANATKELFADHKVPFFKCLINTKTLEIYSFYGSEFGQNKDPIFIERTFLSCANVVSAR